MVRAQCKARTVRARVQLVDAFRVCVLPHEQRDLIASGRDPHTGMHDATTWCMPTSEELLVSASTIARELATLAVVWHLAIVAAIVALLAGWRPQRTALPLVAAPLASVAIVSLVYRNPFNTISFAVLSVVLLALARSARPASAAPAWARSLGGALIGFGFVYPHFTDGSWYRALLVAPVGLVPCPTLAIVAGFTLLAGGFARRAVCAVLAAWTAFYALFGIAKLGVWLDTGLVAAAGGLLALALHGVRIHSARGAHRVS
jgi:hypothetical protein